MPKRKKASRRPKARRNIRRPPARQREPDLMQDIAEALDSDGPLDLLAAASGIIEAFKPEVTLPAAPRKSS